MAILDLQFPLQGKEIPVDHGYYVFAAVSEVIPSLHGTPEIAIHPIRGRLVGDRRLAVTSESCLTFRVSHERLPDLMVLAGKNLRVADQVVRLGVPQLFPLKPAANLWSRLVTIKGFLEPESFLEAAQRQINNMGIQGTVTLLTTAGAKPFEGMTGTRSPFVRRTLRIRDKDIVGFTVRVGGLSEADSILLQEYGVGGRRRMGCGVFWPWHLNDRSLDLNRSFVGR